MWDLDGPFAKIGFASSLLSAVNVTQFQPVPRRHRPNYASVSRQATVHCMCMPEQRHDVQFLLIFIKNHQFLFFFFYWVIDKPLYKHKNDFNFVELGWTEQMGKHLGRHCFNPLFDEVMSA